MARSKKNTAAAGTTPRKSVQVVFPTWKTSRAHRASEPLRCAGYGCGKTIAVGELYTRHKPAAASYYYSVHPFCRVCVPFVEAARSWQALYDDYRESPLGQADRQGWQEKDGSVEHPVFGPSVILLNIEIREEERS